MHCTLCYSLEHSMAALGWSIDYVTLVTVLSLVELYLYIIITNNLGR